MGYNHSFFVDEENPVETITYDEAVEFTHRISSIIGHNFRLPTEMEWRFAAYGGNASRRTTYSGSEKFWEVAWLFENSGDHTHHVGTKLPNELGIYDMSGHVYEWCQDLYGSYKQESQTDPQGPSSGLARVVRGGMWGVSAKFCRVSRRVSDYPAFRNGMRLALPCPPSEN
jgi:formylglycine-generating enzyme required for sulfatase activity